MTIIELARRIAGWRAREYAAARLLGEWIPVAEPGRLRAVFAGWAAHFAGHVDLWDDRAPAVPGVDLLADADGVADSIPVIELGPIAGVDELITTLVTEVWTPLIAELESAAGELDPRLDAPTARVVDLVLADLRRDLDAARSVASAR